MGSSNSSLRWDGHGSRENSTANAKTKASIILIKPVTINRFLEEEINDFSWNRLRTWIECAFIDIRLRKRIVCMRKYNGIRVKKISNNHCILRLKWLEDD